MDDLTLQTKLIRPTIKVLPPDSLRNLLGILVRKDTPDLSSQITDSDLPESSVNHRLIVLLLHTGLRKDFLSSKDMTEPMLSSILICLNSASLRLRDCVLEAILKDKLWYTRKQVCSSLEDYFQWGLAIPLSAETSNSLCTILNIPSDQNTDLARIQGTIVSAITSEDPNS
jgi:hypothetical protein